MWIEFLSYLMLKLGEPYMDFKASNRDFNRQFFVELFYWASINLTIGAKFFIIIIIIDIGIS